MAYFGVLPEVPSFGTQLARGLGKGLGEGVNKGIEKSLEMAKKRALERKQKEVGRSKAASRAFRDLPAYAKQSLGYELTPEEYQKAEQAYTQLLHSDLDMPQEEAMAKAIQSLQSPGENGQEQFGQERGMDSKRSGPLSSMLQNKSEENPFGYFSAASKNPRQAFWSGLAENVVQPAELFRGAKTNRQNYLNELAGLKEPDQRSETPLTDRIKEDTGVNKLSEDTQKKLSIGNAVLSLAPWSKFLTGAKQGGSLATAATEFEGAVAPKLLAMEEKAAETAAKEMSLAGRATNVPNTATELRMNRAGVSAKPSPVNAIIKVRQEQLKAHPKYSEEITKDAAEREVRRAAREPKTPVGEAGLQKRIIIANEKLPKIQNAYDKSLARVTAVENALAKATGEAKDRYAQLYDVAKQELQEAQTDLVNGLANARTGSSKATVEESLKAVHTKLENIESTLEAGKEYKLSGYDYSPKMIAEAKEIAKRKNLPALKQDDFYIQIHERYVQPYRQKLEQVNKDLKATTAYYDTGSYDALKKEKDILEKMIKSAEAEKVIHQHKLALREIQETKKAADRFAQLQPSKAQPKVVKVAEEKMWKSRIQEAKTPEGRAKVIDEAVEETAAKHPKDADPIRKEGEKLKEETEKMREKFSRAKDIPPNQAKPHAEGIFDQINELRKKYPTLMRWGQDIVVGVGTALYDDAKKEYDLPVSGASIASVVLGSRGGYGKRFFINQLAKHLIKEWHVGRAKDQYLSKDPKERRKFSDQAPSIRKKAKEELEEMRRSR